MKFFRHFTFLSVIFLVIIFLNIKSSYAGTFIATLGSDGVIMLDADFSTDFDCVPEGATSWIPWTQIAEIYGCYVLETPSWSAHGERALTCPRKGLTRSYTANSLGGIMKNGVCTTASAGASATVTEITDTEIEIISPVERVKGIEDVVVEYDFKYNNADTCSGHIPNRYVSGFSNLPVRGTVSYPYDFSNQTGVVKIAANACCDGHCVNTDKPVYVEPEDLGNPGGCGDNILVGKPVNAASGNVFTSQTDFTIQGIMPINFTRYYNSKSMQSGGGFTFKWSHTFETRAFGWGNTIIKVINADGSIFYYQDNDNDKVYDPVLPKGIKSRVIMNPDSSMAREFDDGTREEFNKYSYVTAIADRNGNRINLTRNSGNKLTKITDPSGREIKNITYDIYNRITQITLPDGRIINYTYGSGGLQKVTYPDGTYRTYEYSGYNLTGIKDENGNYIEKHTYDSQGRAITSSADGTNEKLTINYVSDTQSTVTDSLGRITTYTIDKTLGQSHPTNISGPGCASCGQGNVSYTYDDNLNITSSTDANGNVTVMTYDTDGNMLIKTEAYGTADERTTTYTYNEFGQVLTVTDPDGNVTSYTYDANGNLLEETDAQWNITSHTYSTNGERLSTTDPNGNTTTYTYDQYGNLASTTNALNQTTTYTYDIMGNLTSMTDANGNTTTYTYDLRDRLIREIRPDGGIIDYEYDLTGNRTATTDANGNSTTYTYDTINRLTELITQNAERTTYTYDSEGNMTSMTIKDSSNNVKTSETYTYDIYNRLIRTTHADSTYTEQTYDALGNVLTKRDENGNITTFLYDALNRLTSVTDPNTKVTSYTYDRRNNLKTVTDANNNITTYNYDSVNRLISTASPDTGTTAYYYDPVGNMTTKTDASNVTTTYVYDALNRQITIQFPDTTQNINYYYDDPQNQNSKGRLTAMTDPSGTTWYDYDKMGRVAMETKQINNLNYRTEYTYDLNGNVATITYPGGRKITYTSNQLNKVTLVSETYLGVTRTLVSNITYQPFGDITSMMYGNGIVTTKTYNNRYQLNNLTVGTLKNLTYTRDNTGNITAIADTLNPSNTKSYTYDNLYRLTLTTGQWGAITYAYDSVSNRTYETTDTGNTTYTYTLNTNKLTLTTGEKNFGFSYDNNGNTTSENTRQYLYNQNQRLTQVTDTGTSTVLGEYIYNGNGQRADKLIPLQNKCTVFHYDKNGLLITESTRTGNIKAEYVYLNGQPLAKIESNNVYYYHNDHLGTPILMTDSSGSVVWSGEFLPFGEPLSVTGSITNNLRFLGQYYDSETGLNQNGYRDYYDKLGRYPQADPIGLLGGINLFNYVENNPVNFIDPVGYFAWKVPFTSIYFYGELKTSPGSKGIGIGFASKGSIEAKHPKLKELTPEMEVKAINVMLRLEARGYLPKIVEALRTKEQQLEKVKRGFSKTLKSKHLDKDGKGACAMDVVDKRWGYDDSKKDAQQFFREYGEIGIDELLEWGGSWMPINRVKGYGWDPGHLQLY